MRSHARKREQRVGKRGHDERLAKMQVFWQQRAPPMAERQSHSAEPRKQPCDEELPRQPPKRCGQHQQPSHHTNQACQLAEHRSKIEGCQVGAQRHRAEAYTEKRKKITRWFSGASCMFGERSTS